MDFINYDKKEFDNQVANIAYELKELREKTNANSQKIGSLESRISALYEKLGKAEVKQKPSLEEEINEICFSFQPLKTDFKTDHKDLYLSKVDIFAAFTIGSLAALIDIFLVKIPKDHLWRQGLNGPEIQEGSPLTALLRKVGVDENGKASGWVSSLEKLCKVPYDQSVNDPGQGINIPGFHPRTHRLQGLAHDPIFGLIFAVFDTIRGTTTAIGTDGVIQTVRTGTPGSIGDVLKSPLIWLGHLLSDVFSKQGLPIPGWGALQTLQFGSFGEKERTVAEISRYMYIEGYDLRHLATMASPVVIAGLLLALYNFLAMPKIDEAQAISDREYQRIKITIRKEHMKTIAYSTLAGGNAIKVYMAGMNPLAINMAAWLMLIKQVVSEGVILFRKTRTFENIIENRYLINENWDILLEEARQLENL